MPSPLLKNASRQADKLGLSSSEKKAFLEAISNGTSGRTALVATPATPPDYIPPFDRETNLPKWVHGKITVLAKDSETKAKPGAHIDYQQGYYYPLDLSSVWETTGLSQINPPQRCLDLCASPGGKSILTQLRTKPELHIANEIHPKRLGILRNNLSRCGFYNLYTHRLRPEQWAAAAPASFDLILVDAPCSGQSLLAKGIDNPWCFNPTTIKGNAKRQRGILHKAIECLAPGGHLLYTTCTFAPEENEKNISYILKKYKEMAVAPVPELNKYLSPIADFPCYRLLPMLGFGSGGFSCLLVKEGTSQTLPDLPEELLNWPVGNSTPFQI